MNMERHPYRLGLDIGANSIGWIVLDVDGKGEPYRIRDAGVRIFHDGRNPRDRTSLATARRLARSQRRRRDRYLARRTGLMQALVRHGLMPDEECERKALEVLDPYELRARGLSEALRPHEFGRALFHLNQRRGFKSNRRVDGGDSDEKGKVADGADRLQQAMRDAGAETLGQYLHLRHSRRLGVRARLLGTGSKAEYERYPLRAMVEKEFDTLWEAQSSYHPDLLTDEARDDIRRILLFQRPLKPVKPGRCVLHPDEERAPWALPLAQRRRIFEQVNSLRYAAPGLPEQDLTLEQRDTVADYLLRHKKADFDRIRTLLKLEPDTTFNFERSEKRKDLKGDETAAVLASRKYFGAEWRRLTAAQQNEIVERLLEEEDEDVLVRWLHDRWNLDDEVARAVANAPLPDGHTGLCREALSRITPALEAAVITYDKATKAAGYPSHSDFRDGEIWNELPYYPVLLERHVGFGSGDPEDPEEKRLGRIANPTVHIGLNQLRRLVNALIAEHGHPDQIVLELARELKLSEEERKKRDREQRDNQDRNDRYRQVFGKLGIADTGENRLRMRLWEELNRDNAMERCCVYTGDQISCAMLFSPDVEIEHLLPFSKTLDNSPANKTVSLRRANRDKGNRTPAEAFANSPGDYDWEKILARAALLPANKRWRFQPDAMEQFAKHGGFLDRHLTDSQYLSRLCREYLCGVCDPNQVWAVPGRLTAMLRGLWGLNSLLPGDNLKSRDDHRHHTVDAAVVAVTDRSLLKRIATAAAHAEHQALDRLMAETPVPWPTFRDELKVALDRLIVSHRADRGTGGRLHEDTAYGAIADPDAWGGNTLVYRKAFLDLNENEVARIRDDKLRTAITQWLREKRERKSDGNLSPPELRSALQEFQAAQKAGTPFQNVRRVRLMKKEADVIGISDGQGCIYKALVPGENHCIDIYADGEGRWRGEGITLFDANRPGFVPRWRREVPDSQRIMRVHKDDLIAIERGNGREIMRVVQLEAKNNRLRLAPHTEAGQLQERHNDPDDLFRWLICAYSRLQEWQARPVSVDMLGRVRDPGPLA